MDADHESEPPAARRLATWQFGLRGLMLLSLSVALCLGLVRWWGLSGFIVFLVFAVPAWLSCLGQRVDLLVLKCLVGYGVVSALTLPFLDTWWIGELPVLAIVQLPKVQFAHFWRRFLVMEVVEAVGLSRGSYSPNSIMVRPYALALAYLIPLGILLPVLWIRTRMVPPYLRWTCALLIVVFLDYWLTLALAGGPGLSVY